MKTQILALVSIATLAAAADEPLIRIQATLSGYAGFKAAMPRNPLSEKRKGILVEPSISARSGQKCMIEMLQGVTVPGQKDFLPIGVTLEFEPTLNGGRIELTGKCTVRRSIMPGTAQPIAVVSILTRETFFSGTFDGGKPFVLHVGDKKTDEATITLTATVVAASK